MRRTSVSSVSLPTKHIAHDPHEKPARYDSYRRQTGTLEKIQAGMMNQAQKTRWMKATAIVVFLMFLFYFMAPKGADIYSEGACDVVPRARPILLGRDAH